MTKKLTFRLIAFALTFTFTFGFSAVRTWTGGTNNSWTTNSNWTGNAKPTSSDDVILNGTGTYQPTTNISGTIKSLSMNGGSLTLNGSLTITNQIIFYKGIIHTTASNILIFNSGASVSGASDSSHVSGPIRKNGNSYGSFTFPTGNGVHYASIRVSSVSGGSAADYFIAQYFHLKPPYNLSSKDNSLNNISTLEYWDLNSNDLDAAVTLSFRNTRSGGIANISDLRVARWDGVKWKNHGGSAAGSITSGTVATPSVLTVFGPFALSSVSSLNALPVSLIDFKAVSVNGNSNLDWTTVSEENLFKFEVCRSTDGKNYYPIGSVNANNNSNDLINYSFTDLDLASIHSTEVYYRLKMIDNLGDFKLSNISRIKKSSLLKSTEINIFPNPATEIVNIKLNAAPESGIEISITDSYGKPVQNYYNPEMSANNSIIFDVRNLVNGVYFINILNTDGSSTSNKFIKR